MAKGFDVDIKDVASSTSGLVGASRGVAPVKAQETVARTAVDNSSSQLLSGVGSLFNQAVGALDNTIKRTVDERAREQMDQVFNEMGVDDTTLIEGTDIDNEPLPADIGKAERALMKLTQARGQGGVTDNAYWARVNTISRQLRSRFPGHRDYIDQTIAKVSGGNPQIAIMRNLMEQQGRVDAAALREEKERSDFIDRHLAILPNDYTDRNKYPTLDALRKQVQPYLAAKEARAAEREGIAIARERGEVVDKMEIESASRTAADVGYKLLNDGMSTSGEKYTDVVTSIKALSNGEAAATPESLTDLRNKFNAFKYEYTQGLDTKLTQEYGGNLSSKAREEARKVGLNMIEAMETAITDKNVGLLNMLANANEAYKQGDIKQINDNFPEARALNAMKEIGGPEAVSAMLNVDNSEVRSVLTRLSTQAAVVDMFGAGKTVQESILRQKVLGRSEPEIAFVASGKAVDVLTDPKQTPAMRKRAAYSLFSTGNAGFVSSLNPTSRDGSKAQHAIAFNRLVNPNVHKAMLELRDSGDTESWDNYVSWSNNTFTAVYQQNANTLVKAAQDKNYFIRWQGDRFEAFESAEGAQNRERINSVTDEFGNRTGVLPQIPGDIRVAVQNMNGALDAMKSIVKDNGLTMTDFVRNTYQMLPASVFVPIGPAPSRQAPTIQGGGGTDQAKGGAEGDRLQAPAPVRIEDIPTRLKELDALLKQTEADFRTMYKIQQEGDQTDPSATDTLDEILVEQEKLIQQYNKYFEAYMARGKAPLKGTVQ